MPRIGDNFLDCVVYLYPSEAEAEDGARIGGSGFFVGVYLDSPLNQHALRVLVTNKHVVHDGNMVARLNTHDGGKDVLPLDDARWIFSKEDDLAICPVLVDPRLFKHNYIRPWTLITKEKIEEFAVGPGDDVFFVGRFIDREGRQRNLPSARFGNISQMPVEPIKFDEGVEQESFPIEARSIAGYSGAPVFLHFLPQPGMPSALFEKVKGSLPDYVAKRQFTQYGIPFEPYLLGVNHCHIFSNEPVINIHTGKPHPDWHVRSNTGMMGVVPAWKLSDLLNGPEMMPIIAAMKQSLQRALATNQPLSKGGETPR